MNTLRILILRCLVFASSTASTLVLAQYENANANAYLILDGRITHHSCLLSAFNNSALNKNVFQLPPMTTTTLDANALGPVTPIEFNLNGLLSGPQCALG